MLRPIVLMLAITCDSLVFMLEKGASLRELKPKTALLHSLIFAFTSLVMLNLGNGLGHLIALSDFIKVYKLIIVFVLFGISILIAVNTFKKKNFEERLDLNFKYQVSLRQAICSSIDVFLMGVSISYLGIPIYKISLLSFIITFIVVYCAIYVGYYRGAAYQKIIGFICALTYFLIANYQLYFIL